MHISEKSSTFAPAFENEGAAGSSSARLECLLWEQEVVSSNLAYPTSGVRKDSRISKGDEPHRLSFCKKSMYKAIFIDIDDTILDYIPCCREAFDAALAVINQNSPNTPSTPNNDALFELFFSISGRLFSEAKHGLHTVAEVMELYPQEFCERAGYPPEAVDPFKHAFRAAWGMTHTLVPGAKETLEALHAKGYRLFAASNSFGHLQRSRLQHAGVLHLFEDTYISMDIGYDKPDVRFYEEALRRCCLSPHEVLMVGDSMTTDIVGAQKAGMDTCWFNKYNEHRNEALPTFIIRHLSELSNL